MSIYSSYGICPKRLWTTSISTAQGKNLIAAVVWSEDSEVSWRKEQPCLACPRIHSTGHLKADVAVRGRLILYNKSLLEIRKEKSSGKMPQHPIPRYHCTALPQLQRTGVATRGSCHLKLGLW